MRLSTLTAALTLALTSGAALAANGDVDLTFGSLGFRYISFDVGGAKTDTPEDLIGTSDGGFLAVGRAATAAGTTDAVAAKVTAGGAIDSGFATGGKYRHIQLEQDRNQTFYAAAAGPNGALVLVGSEDHFYGGPSALSGYRGTVVGLSASGQLQHINYGFGTAQVETEFRAASLDNQGRVVCSGVWAPNDGTDPEFYGFRYLAASGANDPSFALSGDSIVPFDLGTNPGIDIATATAHLADGSVLQAGYTQLDGTDYDFALAQLQPNGDLIGLYNFAFDLAGSAKTDKIRAVAIDNQGRVLLAGEVSDGPGATATAIGLVRLKPDLAPDTTFGTNGKLVLDFDLFDAGARDELGGIAIAGDGKILVVGTHYNSGNASNVSDVALVRLKDDGNADFTFGIAGREFYDFGQGATHADAGVDVEIQGNRAVVLSKREFSGADTDFLLFGVVSAQAPKPDGLFKDQFE